MWAVFDRFRRVKTPGVLDRDFDISYLVPEVDGGYLGEILVAVPKARDGESRRSVFNNTLFRFPTPQAGEVELLCGTHDLRRSAGGDGGAISTWRYSVPACGDIPAVALCSQPKLWFDRQAVRKLFQGGFLRGPKDMWISKDPAYIDRVHRLLSALKVPL